MNKVFYKGDDIVMIYQDNNNDNPTYVRMDSDSNIITQKWTKRGLLHRKGDKPAKIKVRKYLTTFYWCINGKLKRNNNEACIIVTHNISKIRIKEIWLNCNYIFENDMPSYIERYFNGNFKKLIWYNKDKKKHRDGNKLALKIYDRKGNLIKGLLYNKGKKI